jgi:hypothetical protein
LFEAVPDAGQGLPFAFEAAEGDEESAEPRTDLVHGDAQDLGLDDRIDRFLARRGRGRFQKSVSAAGDAFLFYRFKAACTCSIALACFFLQLLLVFSPE